MGGGRRDERWRVIVDWVCEGSRTAASNRGVESQGEKTSAAVKTGVPLLLCLSPKEPALQSYQSVRKATAVKLFGVQWALRCRRG